MAGPLKKITFFAASLTKAKRISSERNIYELYSGKKALNRKKMRKKMVFVLPYIIQNNASH